MSAKGAENLLAVLSNIAPADPSEVDFQLLPILFGPDDNLGQRSLSVLDSIKTHVQRIHELESAIAQGLQNSEAAPDELVDEAQKQLQSLSTLDFDSSDGEMLGRLAKELQSAAADANAALRRLKDTANVVGLHFDNQESDVQAVQAVLKLATTAPLELLNYRHQGLELTHAPSKLRASKQALEQILTLESQADSVLYLDTAPSTAEIGEAIKTFREGDAWYRILQSRWRKARRLHQSLSKNKKGVPGSQRLKELELLHRLNTARVDFHSDQVLRTVCGSHFDGEKTPLNDLLTLASWLEEANVTLEGANLGKVSVDPLTVKRATLEGLKAKESLVSDAADVLERLSETIRRSLPEELSSTCASSWTTRMEAADNSSKVAQEAAVFIGNHFRTGVNIRQGWAALLASREAPKLTNELESLESARKLLGKKFLGRHTDLEPIFGAHTYGSLVKKAGLPKSVEDVLISERCVDNYALLKNYTECINNGWQARLEFATAMAEYGSFQAASWVDPDQKSSSAYARELADKTQRAAESLTGLLAWTQYVAARSYALSLGLDAFVNGLEEGRIESAKLEHAFTYRFYAAIAKNVFDSVPALKRFSGARHAAIRQDYAQLDKQVIKLRGRQIAEVCRRHSNPPAGHHGVRVDDKTDMKLLEHLIPQQRPRVPVRQIIRRAGKAIQELKPCFMMGPQAVAQYLEPGGLHFDIIVMDEASQLRPEQAIGAIARGSQLVVVGDPKQLPPTSFFSRMSVADSEGEDGLGQLATSDAESILDVCIAHFQPVRTLRWHYRSRHESLIAFSNQHFYRGNLVVFPSPFPKSKSLGLSYNYVADGVYENQMNHVEARRIVDAAVDHILRRPFDSMGIVTLNVKQRDLVAELLEERFRSLPQASEFKEKWEAEGMGLFVKNLENVQGDERDCIYISTTFGKAMGTSVVRQNFGPISREGGWRRLNVLFTRARKSVAVFSSMRPEDIVSDNRTPEGTRALRNYLEFARTGVLPMDRETGLPPDSDFEIAVMDVLRNKGYEAVPQLGVAGFRIDIAVKHPVHLSGYLAAIECDGASYHSGVSVRDRDRIRQEILESLGWRDRIWRIWSTDWFRNPLAETDRMLQFLIALREQPVAQEFVVAHEATQEHLQGATQDISFSSDERLAPARIERMPDMVAALERGAEQLVFDADEEDLEIEIGDLVTYAPLESQNEELRVCLTAHKTNPELGLIAETTPLGAILAGATVGETVVLRVPGRAPQSFIVKSIKRQTH